MQAQLCHGSIVTPLGPLPEPLGSGLAPFGCLALPVSLGAEGVGDTPHALCWGLATVTGTSLPSSSGVLLSLLRSEYFRETLRRDIRHAREQYRGEQLSQELARIQQRLDSVEFLSLDIVVNLLLSYRDVQVLPGSGGPVCVP